MGRWHADAVARTGHTVAAIVDQDTLRARALANRHPDAKEYDDLRALDGPVDFVHVCTPLETHIALIETALDAGAHVIAEKPLASSAAETRNLLNRAQSKGLHLVPVHQFLFQRGVLDVMSRLPSLGTLLHFDTTACTAGAEGRSAGDRDHVAIEVLPHALALLCRFVSPKIGDAMWHVRKSRPGELRADAIVSSVTISILVSCGGRPTANAIRLVGERGSAHIDLFHGFSVQQEGRVGRSKKIAQPFTFGANLLATAGANLARRAADREPAYPGLRELVRRSYAAAMAGDPAPISSEETLAVAVAWDEIRRAFIRQGDAASAG
jgi:predicted dehydrogenase